MKGNENTNLIYKAHQRQNVIYGIDIHQTDNSITVQKGFWGGIISETLNLMSHNITEEYTMMYQSPKWLQKKLKEIYSICNFTVNNPNQFFPTYDNITICFSDYNKKRNIRNDIKFGAYNMSHIYKEERSTNKFTQTWEQLNKLKTLRSEFPNVGYLIKSTNVEDIIKISEVDKESYILKINYSKIRH